jgi:PKD repeat protein
MGSITVAGGTGYGGGGNGQAGTIYPSYAASVSAPTVTTGSATNVTTNSATLNGTVNTNGTSTTAWFQYGATSGSYTGTTTSQSVSGTTTASVSASLSSLSAATTYYYRIAGQNIAGTLYGTEASFTTSSQADPTPPPVSYITVSSVNPSNGASGVGTSTTVSATFSETMNGSTLTTDTFKLSGGGSSVSGSVSTSGTKATFTPSNKLAYNTTYTATITTGAQAANAAKSTLSSDYSWSFTTQSAPAATPTPTPTPSDTTAPTGSVTIDNNNSYARSTGVTLNLSATDGTGVTGYYLSTASAVPLATATSWVAGTSSKSLSSDVSHTLSSGDGTKTVYAFYKDAAGNVSNPASDSIILDTTLPTVTSVNPTSGTTTVAVNAAISASFSEAMNASTIGTSTFMLSGGITGSVTVSTGTYTTATFRPSGNLSYNTSYTATVKKDTKDLAGNLMASDYMWSFTTIPNTSTSAPTGSITINNNAVYTTARDVTLNLSATDGIGVTGYYVSSSAATPAATGTSWVSVSPAAGFSRNVSHTLSAGDGTKTVYAFYKNAGGNVSPSASDSIILDTTAPTVTEISPLNMATGIDTTAVVTAAFSEVMDIATIGTSTFTLKGTTTSLVAGTVTVSAGTSTIATFRPLSALSYNGTYTATVTTGVTDLAGNAMASNKSWSFSIKGNPVFDATAPVGLITINNDASYANTSAVTLNLSATDSGGVTGYYISTGSSTPVLSASGWTAASSTASFTGNVSYTLDSGDGRKTVYAFYRDARGNISTAASDSIVLDTIPPTVTQTAPANGASGVSVNTNISATFSEAMDASTIGASTYTLSGGVSGAIAITSGSATTATLSPLSALAYNGAYTATIANGVKDLAGNALSAGYTWNFTTETLTPVVADFTANPTAGKKPLTVQFTDQSTGNVTGWKWSFGDGATDTSQNPSHIYATKGTYTVSLAVSAQYGSATKTVENYITVTDKDTSLIADFTATPTTGAWPLTVQFTEKCVGDVTSMQWDFGDGTTGTGKNPQHIYSKSGNYTIKHTAYNGDSSNTKTVPDYITVTKNESEITLEMSPSEITFGESLNLAGQISPAIQAKVSLAFINQNGGTDTTTAASDTDGRFSVENYFPPSGGSWEASASWAGNDNYKGAESDPVSFTVSPAQVEVTIASASSASESGTTTAKAAQGMELAMTPVSSAVKTGKAMHFTGTVTITPDNTVTRKKFLDVELNLLRLTPDGSYEDPVAKQAILTGDKLGYQFEDVTLSDLGAWEVWVGLNKDESFNGTSSTHVSVEVQQEQGDVAGYAILVEGRVEDESGLDSHNKIIQYIYERLIERGFTDSEIYYFNFDATQEGVDETPSQGGVLDAIKTWASGKMNASPAPLYIILAGHGEKEKFPVYPDVLSAGDLSDALDGKNGLLSRLNTEALEEPVVIIMGSNHSGGFIDDLTPSGSYAKDAKRVVITSCDTEEIACKSPLPPDETVRYGDYFVYELVKYAARGKTLKKCYELAAETIAGYTENKNGNGLDGASAGNGQYFDDAAQHPLLDDNGDGAGTYGALSSTSGKDGEVSATIILGFGTTTASLELTEVSGVTTMEAEDTGLTLYAKVSDASKAGDAWLEVSTPDFSLQNDSNATEQRVVDRPSFNYNSFDASELKYTWSDFSGSGDFDNFSAAGEYGVFYFAQEGGSSGEIASFMRSDVFRNSKDNKPPTAFNPISPVSGMETAVALQFDWEDSIDPDSEAGVTYDLTVSTDENFNTIYYQQKGSKNSYAVVDKAASLKDDTTYYWNVLASDADGGTTSMGTTTVATNNARILGYVRDDDSVPLVSVDLSVRMVGTSTETVTSSNEAGYFELKDLSGGTHLLKAEKTSYGRYREILDLEYGETMNLELTLEKLSAGNEGMESSISSSGGNKCRAKGKGALRVADVEETTDGDIAESSNRFKPKLANGYPGFVKGFVFDKKTNEKINKATITVEGTTGSYKTTENGSYFMQLNSGNYNVSANAAGYETSTGSVRVDALSTTTENIGMTAVTQPAGISGTVRDAKKGELLEGATVTVRRNAVKYTTTTDSSGSYSITGLASGKYKVRAAKNGYKPFKKSVNLNAGQTKELQIRLGRKKG